MAAGEAQWAKRTNQRRPEHCEGPGGETGQEGWPSQALNEGVRDGARGGEPNAEVTPGERGPRARLLLPAHSLPCLPAGALTGVCPEVSPTARHSHGSPPQQCSTPGHQTLCTASHALPHH